MSAVLPYDLLTIGPTRNFNILQVTLRVRSIETNGGAHALRRHVKYMCPQCGDVWGQRIWLTGPSYNRGPVLWRCEERGCASCGDGTLLDDSELSPHITAELPADFLAHEVRNQINKEPYYATATST